MSEVVAPTLSARNEDGVWRSGMKNELLSTMLIRIHSAITIYRKSRQSFSTTNETNEKQKPPKGANRQTNACVYVLIRISHIRNSKIV